MSELATRPSFLRRLWFYIVVSLKILLVLAIIGGAGWFIYEQLTRSFTNIERRMEQQDELAAQRLDLVRSDVDNMMVEQDSQDSQLSQMEEEIDVVDEELAIIAAQLSTDLSRQEALLTILEGYVEDVKADAEATDQNIDALNAGIVALQGDVNENIAAVDELGGDVDALDGSVGVLDDEFVGLEDMVMDEMAVNAASVSELAESLMLFRAWEMVYRARLRLLENNVGSAQIDISVAQATLAGLVESSTGGTAETLGVVQTRLELAALSLPSDPDTAVRDLESAWVTIDNILSALLGLPEIVLPESAFIISPTVSISATVPVSDTSAP